MPTFDARIRRDYTDIAGLVLDLNSQGISADLVSQKVSSWRNDAPSRIFSSTNPRYANAVQIDEAVQPTLGQNIVTGIPHVAFDRSAGQHLLLDVVGDFGPQKADYTFSYEMNDIGPDFAIDQVIFGTDELDLFAKANPVTSFGWRTDVTTTVQAGPHPDDSLIVYVLRDTNLMDRYVNGSTAGFGIVGGAASIISLGDDTMNPVATIGGDNAAGSFFGGSIRNMRVWNRELQPNEVLFANQTLSADPAIDFSTGLASIATRVWDDRTATPPRVNPSLRASHLFLLATIPIGGTGFIHLEATIDGVLVPDSGLGGALFTVNALESPNGSQPLSGDLQPGAGLSALQEVRLEDTGHYTLEMRLAGVGVNNGAVILHIDCEEA